MTSVDEAAMPGVGAGQPRAKLAGGAVGPIAVGIALLSAFVTFVVLTGLTPIVPTHDVVVSVLLVNAATVCFVLAIIVREVALIVRARRQGTAGARLHVRI